MLCRRISMGGMAPYFSSEAREMPPGNWVALNLEGSRRQYPEIRCLRLSNSHVIHPIFGNSGPAPPPATSTLASSFTGMLRSSTMTTHIRPGHRSCKEQLGRKQIPLQATTAVPKSVPTATNASDKAAEASYASESFLALPVLADGSFAMRFPNASYLMYCRRNGHLPRGHKR